ncbi:MAG TPA: hypothetical protein VIJ20_09410, partial [Solirubrobacteraceae bacterium]
MRRRVGPAIVAVLAVALLLVAASRHRGGQPAPIPHGVAHGAVLGPVRTLPPGLLGVNGEAIIGPGVWSNPRFLSAVAALGPQAIRVFGGTPANFWDWRTGTYVHSPRVPSTLSALRDHIQVSLADWARLVRATGAMPVFDLNLYTSDLRSQLAMLHAARRLGMPITHVELGNELYLPGYARRFRDGARYGRVASRWIAAIRRAFPGVLVAADAYPGRDSNSGTVDRRERLWNAEMLRTLRGESALSLHAYFASGIGPRASLDSPAAAEKMLRAPGRRWATLDRLIARLPKRLEIWLTEWNLFDTVARVHGTWAQGLAVTAFALDLLSAPRVIQADYETLIDSAPFGAIFGTTAGLQLSGGGGGGAVTFRPVLAQAPATPLFGLATGGVAMQALLRALAGASFSRPISFRSAPVRGIGTAGRFGVGAVIVNLSAKPMLLSL